PGPPRRDCGSGAAREVEVVEARPCRRCHCRVGRHVGGGAKSRGGDGRKRNRRQDRHTDYFWILNGAASALRLYGVALFIARTLRTATPINTAMTHSTIPLLCFTDFLNIVLSPIVSSDRCYSQPPLTVLGRNGR